MNNSPPNQNNDRGADPLNPAAVSVPGVSVVIPAYNYAKFLTGAVDSVLQQTYPDFELIVVDDGSVDDTRAVMGRYQDKRVRYVYQENSGLSAARNTGIAHAWFDYIAFLDADDLWMPNFLESAMKLFATLSSDYGMVAGGCASIDGEGNRIEEKKLRIRADRELHARDFILKNPAPLSSSVILRRSVFRDCGVFDTTLRSSEDRDMWIRTAGRYRVFFICKPLVQIRKHGHSMSRDAVRMRENTLKTIAKAYRSRTVSRLDVFFWLRVLGVYYFETAWTYYATGMRGGALGFIAKSLLVWPGPLPAARLNEPPFFRLRALLCFLLRGRQKHLSPARFFKKHSPALL
ncbi:MAG: glycosyltransferase [Verrucomicrobiota bacterium]